ncbi:MAG TPA: amidohydrolase family protein [Anaerolineales bacterium]
MVAYTVIDGDGHVTEPLHLLEYVEQRYRDLAPRVVKDDEGYERIAFEGKLMSLAHRPPISLGAFLRPANLWDPQARQRSYADAHPGGWDPHVRIKDMDGEGFHAAVLYPGFWFPTSSGTNDVKLAAAMCRAYNNWLADYCKPYPNRLYGMAILPMQDIAEAIREMRRVVKDLNMKGVVVRPSPHPATGHNLHDPAFAPFWAEAQELNIAVAIHEAAVGDRPTGGLDRFHNLFFGHLLIHPIEQQLGSLALICGGVLERFPRLRVAFLEAGGGWMVYWLERMDRDYHQLGFLLPELKHKPSEYFARQCWVCFEPDEKTMGMAAQLIGEERIIWASDYPHFDAEENCVATITGRSDLSESAKQKILGENAAKLYNLPY